MVVLVSGCVFVLVLVFWVSVNGRVSGSVYVSVSVRASVSVVVRVRVRVY